ncbi:MAG: nitrous oxide reductase accessory protein NosL [Natronomonas sp.]
MTRSESWSMIDRRRMLGAMGTGAVGLLAGCLGGEELPEPVDLDDGQACDQCGMVIEDHPGPVGEIYFEDNAPDDRDGPAWFCSSICTYTYRFDRTDEGWSPIVTYLTDYSTVDYTVSGDDNGISAHLAADDFAAESDLMLVVRSQITGAMGKAIVPFGDEAEAESFADTYDGETIDPGEITRELVDEMGM